tara:strand:+ start:34 stop:276 length:243 start_codon:yes stop_codon:yes gene_type:complete
MKLYLLEQNDNNDYDTYDSCLVCAENESDARTIDPNGNEFKESAKWSDWALSKDSITCKEIGEANDKQERGVIIASYNAG